MASYRSVSLVLAGIVLGLGASIACGSQTDSAAPGGTVQMPAIPGVGTAMAQDSACTQWEVAAIRADKLTATGSVADALGADGSPISARLVPNGWTPLTGIDSYGLWITRCAQ